MAIPTPIWERPLRHCSALKKKRRGLEEFGVLIHFIGSERRLATSCHISLNLLRTHAIVGEREVRAAFFPPQPVFPTIFYKQFNRESFFFHIVCNVATKKTAIIPLIVDLISHDRGFN